MKFTTATVVAFVAAVSADYTPEYPVDPPAYPVESPTYPVDPPVYPSKDPEYPTTTPCTTSTDYPVYPKYPVSSYEDKYPIVSYTTKVVDSYTTYCPYPTTYTHEGKEYPVTTPGYVTLYGPVTVTYPVYTKSANATKPTAVSTYKPVATAGAGKTVAFSGAALALAMGVAALL
jgi:hypothetical protein